MDNKLPNTNIRPICDLLKSSIFVPVLNGDVLFGVAKLLYDTSHQTDATFLFTEKTSFMGKIGTLQVNLKVFEHNRNSNVPLKRNSYVTERPVIVSPAGERNLGITWFSGGTDSSTTEHYGWNMEN